MRGGIVDGEVRETGKDKGKEKKKIFSQIITTTITKQTLFVKVKQKEK